MATNYDATLESIMLTLTGIRINECVKVHNCQMPRNILEYYKRRVEAL